MMKRLIETLKESATFLNLPFVARWADDFYLWWTIAKPESSTLAEYARWRARAKKIGPIRFWIREDLVQIVSKFFVRPWIDGWLWVRFRTCPKSRRHVVVMRYLKPGPHSSSSRLLHSVMEVISEFYENRLAEDWDWNLDEEEATFSVELAEVYDWWKTYPEREKNLPPPPEPPEGWHWTNAALPEYENHPYALALKKTQKVWTETWRQWEEEENRYLAYAISIRDKLID